MVYLFDDYSLDPARRELRRGTALVALEPQVFDFLQYLIAERERVVSKDDLIAAVWGGRIVSDSTLSSRITAVRQAIGDSGETQRLIRTFPRKGLRFVGHVREAPHANDTAPAVPALLRQHGPLPPASLASERRQVTVMVFDILGSLAVAAHLDPEDLGDIAASGRSSVRDVVEGFGGFLAKSAADGLFAYFGYPQAHEDDAERAVRAGLELIRAFAGVRIDGVEVKLQPRVSIATSMVVVGEGEPEAAAEPTLVGEAPHLAVRLLTLADLGAIVISESTRRLAGGMFEYGDLGRVRLKGLAEPVQAWQVLGASTVESRFEAQHGLALTPLVGREEELELLLRRWQRAKSGEGQVVLLSGEAGIGKSRLIVALEEKLQTELHTRLQYFCSPHHADTAFFPIISQLERAAGFERHDAPETKLYKLTSLLGASSSASDIQLLADLLSVPIGDRYPPLDWSHQRKKEKTFEALLRQLEMLSGQRPVLMVYEDVHWIDPSSRELLDMTVDRVASLPVLLIITFRAEFEPPWTGQPRVFTLNLSRLGRREGAALVEQVAGNNALPDEIMAEIVERTDGVPLFVEELTKAVLEAGSHDADATRAVSTAPLPALAVPATLHASLMARLDRLGPVSREIAQTGAAIGREFSYELLASVAQKSDADLQAALGRLSDAGLVFCRGTSPQATFLFKHVLVRDAAYATLLRERRRELHARIAWTLENVFAEVAAAQPDVLARHCAEAGWVEKAIMFYQRAGEQCVARSAIREAVAQFSKGLDQLSRLPESRDRHHLELDLQSALGNVLGAIKGFAAREPAQAYDRVRELSELLGERRNLCRMMFGHWLLRANAGEVRAAQEIAEELLHLGEQRNEPAGLMMGHLAMAGTLLAIGDFSCSRFHIDRLMALHDPDLAIALVQQIGTDAYIGGWSWLPMDLFLLGYPDQAREQSTEVMVAVRRRGHAPTAGWCLSAVCRVYALLGERSLFVSGINEFTALAEAQNFPLWTAQATAYRGWASLATGNTKEGVALLEKGVSDYKATGALFWLPFLMSLLAAGYRAIGDAVSERRALREALNLAERTGDLWFTPELHRLKGLVASVEGVEAEREFQFALEIARRQRAKLWELRASTSLARLWRDQGKRTEARDLLAPIYGWFTEGFDTPDLKEAKALLEELA